MEIISGKDLASRIREDLGARAASFAKSRGRKPGLGVVLVEGDPASEVYVRNKERACDQTGLYSRVVRLPHDVSQEDLLAEVGKLNADSAIDGFLVQLPLPDHIDEEAVLLAIDPAKDVDGFHPANAGALMSGGKGMVPCTPRGIIELIRSTGQPIEGKHAVVVGRSNIVGKPLALLLLQENATVTICHSRTRDLPALCREADILVSATGRPGSISGEHVRPGAIVIDVGTTRTEDGLKGDVDFEDAAKVAGWITPVPGGVGPMTITMLLSNTLDACGA